MLQGQLGASRSTIKIGSLLVKSGVVRPEALTAALEFSRRQQAPVGTVLIKLAELREQDLTTALHLQTFVNEGTLSLETAIRALNLAHRTGLDALVALKQLGWEGAAEQELDPICDLMLRSGFLNPSLYKEIIGSDSPLGFCFVMRGILSCSNFNEILRVASLIQRDLISFEEGVQALIKYRQHGIPVMQGLVHCGLASNSTNVRLGELLTAAGLLSEADLLVGIEQSLRTKTQLGDVLVLTGNVPPKGIEVALDAQRLVNCGVMDKQRAVAMIRNCMASKMTVREFARTTGLFAEDENESATILQFFNLGQIVGEVDVRRAMNLSSDYAMGPVAALAFTGRIDRNLYNAAWACLRKLDKHALSSEQAIVILQLCERLGCDIDEASQFITPQYEHQPSEAKESAVLAGEQDQEATLQLPKPRSKFHQKVGGFFNKLRGVS